METLDSLREKAQRCFRLAYETKDALVRDAARLSQTRF